jgi:hypothetical protein
MRRVEGEEESQVVVAGDGGGPMSRWLSNKGCVLCRCPAVKVIYNTTWGLLSLPPPTQVCHDLPCVGGACDDADGWEGRAVYCSEDCRLHQEIHFFEWEFGIRD